MSANSLKILHKIVNTVFVTVPLVTYYAMCGCNVENFKKQTTFSAVQDVGERALCAVGNPSRVLTTRSNILCMSSCQETHECLVANWKNSKSCELFFDTPNLFEVRSGCRCFSPSSIRLVGESKRLEMFVNTSWATVLHSDWTTRNSIVACRQLGFHEGQQTNHRLGDRENIVIQSNFLCVGNEEELLNCKHSTPNILSDFSNANEVHLLCYTADETCGQFACNGGYRVDDQHGYYCINCSHGFIGSNCQKSVGNSALGRPAFRSSAYNGGTYNASASLAVDGDNATIWSDHPCSATADLPGGPNWLVVDLGQPIVVDFVVLTNRGDCCADRLDNFTVGLTNTFDVDTNPPIRGTYALCGKYPGAAGSGARLTVYCSSRLLAARYVIIQQPVDGPGWLTVCELEVYGI